MKKLPVLLLLSMFTLGCLYGCGSESADTSDAASADAPSQEVKTDDSAESQDTDVVESSGAEFLTYDDLPREERMQVDIDHCIIINLPIPCEGTGNGLTTYSYVSTNYYYVAVCGTEIMPDADLEDAFLELLNREGSDGYHATLNMASHGTYDEMTPEMEYVTLDTGAEAIRFTGIQHKDDYGTPYDCVVYGYATMCDGVPVIVSYLIEDEELVDEATKAELGRFVDEMINTVHLSEW